MQDRLTYAYRIVLIILATIACNVDRPLPPPQNPLTLSRSCRGAAACTDEQVCHLAIGSGSCASPCTDNSVCAGYISGYLCHPGLGATCAPDCRSAGGDRMCAPFGAYTCDQNTGRCQASPADKRAQVRFFNALPYNAYLILDGVKITGDVSGNGIAPGGLSETAWLDAKPQTFSPAHADTGETATNAVPKQYELIPGRSYIAVAADFKNGDAHAVITTIVEEVGEAEPLPGQVWFRYLNETKTQLGIARIEGATRAQIFATVSADEVPDARQTPAGLATLAVDGGFLGRTQMTLAATLDEAAKSYTALTWTDRGILETVLIPKVGKAIVRSSRPARVRAILGPGINAFSASVGDMHFGPLSTTAVKQLPNTGPAATTVGSYTADIRYETPAAAHSLHIDPLPLAEGELTTFVCGNDDARACAIVRDAMPKTPFNGDSLVQLVNLIPNSTVGLDLAADAVAYATASAFTPRHIAVPAQFVLSVNAKPHTLLNQGMDKLGFGNDIVTFVVTGSADAPQLWSVEDDRLIEIKDSPPPPAR